MQPAVGEADPWVMFESITFLGTWKWPDQDSRSTKQILAETMSRAMNVPPEKQVRVALMLPTRGDGKVVLFAKASGDEIYSLPMRQITSFTGGHREHPSCFAFVYAPAATEQSCLKMFCFDAMSAEVRAKVHKRIEQAYQSIQNDSNEAQLIAAPCGSMQIVNVQMTLDIREEDSRGAYAACSRTKELFKLRKDVEKQIVLTIEPMSHPSPINIERCFGVLVSPGRHVRHSDMQLIGTGSNDSSNQQSSPSSGFTVVAKWDPKDNPPFELLNTVTSGESRVYLTVACDLVLMHVKEPVRFVFETQARIGPAPQDREKALVWSLPTALRTGSVKPFTEYYTLILQQQSRDNFELAQMTTSTGRVLHPIEQMTELGESDDDEPLLSGSGPVGRESGQEKLDEWGDIIKHWKGNAKPKEVDALIQNFGVPQSLRCQVWQLLGTSKSDMEDHEYYQMLVKKENSAAVDQAIERDIHRTFPGHDFFKETQGQESLYRLCKAYSLHDIAVSYCQGLSYLAAALLLHIPEEQTFFLLNVIMSNERYNMRQLYLDNFETLHVKLYQLAKLYSERIPEIGSHFRDLGVEPHMFASQWLLTLYTAKFPLYLVFLVLDNFLLTGPDFLFKIAVALLMESKRDLLTLDFEGVLKHFRVSIPRKYRNEEAALRLVRTANHVKVSSAKLKKWEKDFLQEKEANSDPKEIRRMLNAQQRLDQENDDLVQELISVRLEFTRHVDAARDRIDALSKELASAQQFATDVSTENQELREQLQQLKEMCRREAETAEATIRQQEDTIFEYKKICGRLQEVNQAIQADRNRNKRKQNGEDTQEEESELEQQLRELELELAQTKLALVESECHCQELNHQLARNAQDKEKAQGTPWLSKTIQGIIKKQNSQVDSS
ncbi:rab GTPase-activating protein 1-like isoform X2 [Varroa jacobsoni]|nr:rab GTPase-activating protein 1-like isoform X2 [Varroa destructor]XP_022689580.1 rab GTPase-activating protein 1-like isoform X2 [Varroa jacobsoni]XP_022689581.1 rab GTPase-activating protein 1-like isoform X2 [Varroa jacobsoni]